MFKKTLFDDALTALVVLCALVTTGLVLRREFSAPTSSEAPALTVKDWRTYAVGSKRIGPEDAALTIVAFTDYQCQFCAKADVMLDQAMLRYSGKVAVVYRHLPLERIHPLARAAALASECAARQSHFREYHDYLFQHQLAIEELAWTRIAMGVGIKDTAAFRTCLGSDSAAGAVQRDIADAGRLHLLGTPALLIGRRLQIGVPADSALDDIIAEELARRGK